MSGAHTEKPFEDAIETSLLRSGWQKGLSAYYNRELGLDTFEMSGKRAAVVYTSAVWGPGVGAEFGSDFQSTFFDGWLRWAGIDDVQEIRHHPTLTGSYEDARKQADERAREVARRF
jgi:hypothetical protein